MANRKDTAEQQRIDKNALNEIPLEKWGPYLSERQWGTVREDYSEGGDAWNYFPHDHARSRAYRWGEDGIAGISDYFQNLCFAVALWNGKDPILKERLFGLTNGEGNHGEDVKELYYYLDNVPSHYYMKYLYKYPHGPFPYNQLIQENARLSKLEPEFEILDSGIFNEDRYFDVYVEYAKKNSEDIFIKIEVVNRSIELASLTVLPTLWYFNSWQFSNDTEIPSIEFINSNSVEAKHSKFGNYYMYFNDASEVLFTENETNYQKLFNKPNKTIFAKDAFHEAIINGHNIEQLREIRKGTKCAPVYQLQVEGHESKVIFIRLSNELCAEPFEKDFQKIFSDRKAEADEFYESLSSGQFSEEELNIQRQAFAGLLWSKQYYHYDVEAWINSSDGITAVTDSRLTGRNHQWKYLKNQDVIIMPDKWEYPWYASWDTAFHCIAVSIIDPGFAKHQLLLLMREWYMSPNGQIPAYEWNFSDVNPPVHALAAFEVYKNEKKIKGKGDLLFLKKIFQKLIINFTWWINRKDSNGNNIFEGGFLGLDNIGVFNRNMQLPGEISLEQADGTSWMGMYALNMMDIAIEIATTDPAFEDTATKFYEHFIIIAEALNELGLWNEKDQFFYDLLSLTGQDPIPLKVRSIVGVSPLFAVSIIKNSTSEYLKDFRKRTQWFNQYRINRHKFLPDEEKSASNDIMLSLVQKDRLVNILNKLLDESEFLSGNGIRALSKYHALNQYEISVGNYDYSIQYDPGDSTSALFGGNSNWRGPVWMPINYLIINAIRKFGAFYGNEVKVEYPTHSGILMNLQEIAEELTNRILKIYKIDSNGNRPVYGQYQPFYNKKENRDLLLFHEYFHGETGRGLGASHQTGWTSIIVSLFCLMKETN